jgi:hypothetical protein
MSSCCIFFVTSVTFSFHIAFLKFFI